jgi:hypothetical protein
MFRKISLATLLTLSMASASFGGTIPGSRSSRVGTITGSRTGTITGSRTGTITGSRGDTISGSRTDLLPAQTDRDSRFRVQDGLLSGLWLLLNFW